MLAGQSSKGGWGLDALEEFLTAELSEKNNRDLTRARMLHLLLEKAKEPEVRGDMT